MSDNNATLPVPAGERHTLVGQAVVDLTVSFPPVSMSVADVEALHPLQVIDLGIGADSPRLSVTVAGRRVGIGRLVLVGNNAGVLLTPETE